MKYWAVRHTHTEYTSAENETDALETVAQSVRDNASAEDCEAQEVTEEEYEKHWQEVMS